MIKILVSSVAATACSIIVAMCVLFVLGLIVHIFKLNYGKDAYWAFSVAFIISIISWVIVFGSFIHLTPEKNSKYPLFTKHAENCKLCGGGATSEEGGPAPLCEKGFELLQQDVRKKHIPNEE
jgi:hypothetical protein